MSLPPDPETDLELVRRAKKGDQAAFGMLVGRYQQRVILQAQGWCKNRTDAEDIAQESFVRAWKGLRNFRGQSAFYTWLFRIVANTANSWVRSASSQPVTMDEENWQAPDIQAHLTDHASPESTSQQEALAEMIRRELDLMPMEQRQALMLREQEDMTYDQIADIMQTPIGTVRSRIFRARSELAEKVRQWQQQNDTATTPSDEVDP